MGWCRYLVGWVKRTSRATQHSTTCPELLGRATLDPAYDRDWFQGRRSWWVRGATPLVLLLLFLAAAPAHAVEPDEIMPDKAMESRARTLSAELRCLVCQNQSIDDSNAPLARDLRLIVRERLKAGDSEDAVRAFLVARYGTFVLLRPPVERSTLLLWATPGLLLGLAGWLLWRRSRASGSLPVAPEPLSKEEVVRLDRLTRS